jgi:hypothetical protein
VQEKKKARYCLVTIKPGKQATSIGVGAEILKGKTLLCMQQQKSNVKMQQELCMPAHAFSPLHGCWLLALKQEWQIACTL